MHIDYHTLSAYVVINAWPLPCTDELLSYLREAKYFSRLNMYGSYHQTPIYLEDRVKTVFAYRYGAFAFAVIMLGQTNMPENFKCSIKLILHNLLDNGVYLNYILIYTKTKRNTNGY